MQVTFQQVSKRYKYDWILKGVNFQFEQGRRYAITGPNGSGKSTFLKLLSGHLSPSNGKVVFQAADKKLAIDQVYRSVSFAAPYIDLIEEFTLQETLVFHNQFKPFAEGIRPTGVIELLGFSKSRHKQIRHFSSGMKQRLKLALACCTGSSLLLLDEPTSNLDTQGIDWYQQLVERFGFGKTVVVASNVEIDFSFCEKSLDVMDYK